MVSNLQNTPENTEQQVVKIFKNLRKPPQADQYGNYIYYPQIKLFGKWLKAASFQQGQTIKITVEEGRLIIEPSLTKTDGSD